MPEQYGIWMDFFGPFEKILGCVISTWPESPPFSMAIWMGDMKFQSLFRFQDLPTKTGTLRIHVLHVGNVFRWLQRDGIWYDQCIPCWLAASLDVGAAVQQTISESTQNYDSWPQNRRQNMAEPQINRPKVSKLEVVAKCLKYVTHCDTGAFIREWGEQLGWLSIVLMHQSPIPYVKRTLDQRLIHAELPTSPIPSRGAPKCITTAGDA